MPEPIRLSDALWCALMQPLLLRMAADPEGRDFLGIEHNGLPVVLLEPHAAHFALEPGRWRSVFYTGPVFTDRLRKRWESFRFLARRRFYDAEHLCYVRGGLKAAVTSTLYPDAHPESTSVDGVTFWQDPSFPASNVTFATARANAGNFAEDVPGSERVRAVIVESTSDVNRYSIFERGHTIFDTSTIPPNNFISAATLSLYGVTANNNAGATIVSSAPASNTALAAGDHVNVGSTSFGTVAGATGTYNDGTLNATGRATIGKGAGGRAKFALRQNNDFSGVAPSWIGSGAVHGTLYQDKDTGGTSTGPKLTIEHEGSFLIPIMDF